MSVLNHISLKKRMKKEDLGDKYIIVVIAVPVTILDTIRDQVTGKLSASI
jgi:hypothetical protein